MLLIPISKETFKEKSKISFSRIDFGFNKYTSGILAVPEDNLNCTNKTEKLNFIIQNENKYIEFIKKVYLINKNNPVMIDFYLKDISNEGILKILDNLDYDDKLVFLNHIRYLNKEAVYFYIDNENLLPFLTRLSTRELLFCTIHFTNIPITIWGNYNLNFPLFFENVEKLEFYDKLAKTCGLLIRDKIIV
jgi:hypothetical protein